jgi:subtilisin family serine protease
MSDPVPAIFGQLDPHEFLRGATGRGVKVAVVDSGVDSSHPDLAGHVKGGVVVVETGGQVEFRPYDGKDAAGHGTGCAGVIARLAPEAEIYSVRVLSCIGVGADGYKYAGGKPRHMIYGLVWAIENCHVINVSNGLLVSEGTAFFDAFYKLVEKAYYNDRVVVAAGENQGLPSYPSVFSNVIPVYWGSFKDPLQFAYQLRPNTFTEFLANGSYVKVPQPGGGHIYEIGSSFAAPHISAICALILSKFPGLKLFQIKTLLYGMAQKLAPLARTIP